MRYRCMGDGCMELCVMGGREVVAWEAVALNVLAWEVGVWDGGILGLGGRDIGAKVWLAFLLSSLHCGNPTVLEV